MPPCYSPAGPHHLGQAWPTVGAWNASLIDNGAWVIDVMAAMLMGGTTEEEGSGRPHGSPWNCLPHLSHSLGVAPVCT